MGIKRVHGFLVVGSPGETIADILVSSRFAAQLKLARFGLIASAPIAERYCGKNTQ
jgi:hypothetical protein